MASRPYRVLTSAEQSAFLEELLSKATNADKVSEQDNDVGATTSTAGLKCSNVDLENDPLPRKSDDIISQAGKFTEVQHMNA